MEPMKTVMKNVSDLKPASWNPRIMSRHDMESLKGSLSRWGLLHNLVINKDGVVLSGNQRLEAAKANGLKRVPVVIFEGNEQEQRAFAVAANRVHGDWDQPKLEALLAEMRADEFDLTSLGFTTTELERMLKDFEAELPESGVARGDAPLDGTDLVAFVVHLRPSDYAAVMNALAKTGKSTLSEQLIAICKGN